VEEVMPSISYKAAERFILSREFFGMKLGLDNIASFLESLGNPQNAYRTIHLAGTNGKGSTAAMLAAALLGCGYKVGLFTSPHLVDFRERIRINDRKIAPQSIIRFVEHYREILVKKNSRSLKQ
jgi:dihydrofolate synthase/folylpolyglutamate synthase